MTHQSTVITRLRDEFRLERLLPSLIAGLVAGVITITVVVAFAALVFSGTLSDHIPAGIGMMLFGSIIIAGLTALTSSLPGVIAGSQDTSAAIIALVSVAIVDNMPASASDEELYFTVIAAICLAAILTGTTFLLLGQFRLGNLIRFIPYPVIGGFLAGSGLLLVRGAISVMTNEPVSFTQLSPLVEPDLIAHWLPGLVFALALMVVLRRFDHYLTLPAALLGAIAVFYIVMLVMGASASEATDNGWLLEGLPKGGGSLWDPVVPSDLKHVDWSVLLKQVSGLVAVIVVTTITLLLNATGIELATHQDIDLNRELKVAGLSNVAAGLGGGVAGSHVLSETALAYRIGARSRLVGLLLAGVCAFVLFAGASLLSYFPKPVLGGLLLFLGLDFLIEWVYKTWFKLSKADYAIVILIMLVINVVGFLEGIGAGLACAVALFVVDYSRIGVVKHALSGAHLNSHVVRPYLYQQLLREKGDWLYILRLHSFIFFGTSYRLLEQVRARILDPDRPKPHFIVFDFRLVTGLDSSAVLSFIKMAQLAEAHKIKLVFTSLPPAMLRQIEKELFTDGDDDPVWRLFPDLDHGVEWCENQVIALFESIGLAARPQSFRQQLVAAMPDTDQADILMQYFEHEEAQPGAYLIRQGQPPDGLQFIESGQVTVQLELESGEIVRLRKMTTGTIVGEIGLYTGQPASASVVIDEPSTLYRLGLDALQRLEQEHPNVASAFHRFMARFLAERLAHTTDTIQTLMK
ncbi:MAG: SLC26A/SulP transporter family protein [Anaerolineae bacterium]|nr:SLC26A/SulP transporter family protein [Anaerolineae bacterium]